MNVVVNAACRQQYDFVFPRDATEILKQSRLNFRRDKRSAFLRAENAVQQLADERMRHFDFAPVVFSAVKGDG